MLSKGAFLFSLVDESNTVKSTLCKKLEPNSLWFMYYNLKKQNKKHHDARFIDVGTHVTN